MNDKWAKDFNNPDNSPNKVAEIGGYKYMCPNTPNDCEHNTDGYICPCPVSLKDKNIKE